MFIFIPRSIHPSCAQMPSSWFVLSLFPFLTQWKLRRSKRLFSTLSTRGVHALCCKTYFPFPIVLINAKSNYSLLKLNHEERDSVKLSFGCYDVNRIHHKCFGFNVFISTPKSMKLSNPTVRYTRSLLSSVSWS